ncbi:hypothetical protein WA026_013541 [Henosepilachna vigintioctopunctata]|uniref:Helicase ATP-binding domain-containing protein n=1 Tax=Henosepilachna vigintioctopunctata TaxID=420089 RepID=A0AAW1VF79_9CUCU
MWHKKLNICKNMFLYIRNTCVSSASINNFWSSLQLYNLKNTNFCKEIENLDVFSQQFFTKEVKRLKNDSIKYTNSYNKIAESLRELVLRRVLNTTIVMKCGENCMNKLFTEPKRTIHNFYLALAREYHYDKLDLSPVVNNKMFGEGTKLWICEYTVKWPELKTFSYMDIKKKRATSQSASAVIQFLLEKNVISSSGTPLLCRKQVFDPFAGSDIRCFCTRSSNNIGKRILNPIIDKDFFSDAHEEQDVEHSKISQLFKTPKHTLGTIFQIVSKEKGSKEFGLLSTFRKNKNLWVCDYKIRWPEEKSFTASGKTKQIASTKCSLIALEYLLESKKITKNGLPLVYDQEDIKELVQSNIPTLYLNETQREKLDQILNLHNSQIFPIICETNEKISNIQKPEENLDITLTPYQKYLGYNQYKAKEKIHLPVSDYKEQIIEMMKENRVLIVKGEPGCGKSTRIPQYILEGWARQNGVESEPCQIVVTEPRRIAAVSLAERVASERDEEVGSIVGYQVRFKSSFRQKTGRILYCTNGILLRQLKADPNLSKYTHVVIDEAHERDINTDLLINLLKKMLDDNPSLKVVIMSATIDTSLFQNYFEGSAVIHIPGKLPIRKL